MKSSSVTIQRNAVLQYIVSMERNLKKICQTCALSLSEDKRLIIPYNVFVVVISF